jgi:hypothetical protein
MVPIIIGSMAADAARASLGSCEFFSSIQDFPPT